jgi:eukaryotic-like serine/threonine-protein kinase
MANLVGRYEVQDKLGEGGMAEVYLARDPYMQRQVAIKLLSPSLNTDQEVRRRFEQEAVVIAALEHSYIVPIYDFGYYGDQPFIVMRYMAGGSLKERLQNYGPLSLANAARIIERMASALDEAHSRGYFHRDVKPDNILLDQQGGTYLSDFGLVKIVLGDHSGTKGKWFAGTPDYMSPEQIHGRKPVGAWSDVYALAVSLFEMLSGQLPYIDKNPMRLMMKHVQEPTPSIRSVMPTVDRGVEAVLLQAMAKEPEHRHQSAIQFSEAVSGFAFQYG